nr:hypothetical protein [Tanacetum cinerariifolium]
MKFVSTFRRGAWMIALFVSCSIRTSTEALLAWGIVERYGWRLLLRASSLPSLAALLFYTLVPESPRFLYAKGELGKASKILNWGAELNKRQLLEEKAEGKRTSEKGAQNEREVVTLEEDEIKDVTLDIDKIVAGPKVEQGNLENKKEDETNKKTKLIIRHNNTHEFLDITGIGIVERYGWRLLLRASSLPSLAALLFYTLVPESPRFLYAKGELGKASKILNWGAELNKRQLLEESTSDTEKAEGKRTSEKGAQNEREVVTLEEDEIKDVTLDIDKIVAGEIQIDEAHHTLKKDDPIDRSSRTQS